MNQLSIKFNIVVHVALMVASLVSILAISNGVLFTLVQCALILISLNLVRIASSYIMKKNDEVLSSELRMEKISERRGNKEYN